MTPEQAAIDRRSLVCGLATAAGAGLYMTQEQLAEYPPSINPKLIALAAAFDKEIERIFSDEDAPFKRPQQVCRRIQRDRCRKP